MASSPTESYKLIFPGLVNFKAEPDSPLKFPINNASHNLQTEHQSSVQVKPEPISPFKIPSHDTTCHEHNPTANHVRGVKKERGDLHFNPIRNLGVDNGSQWSACEEEPREACPRPASQAGSGSLQTAGDSGGDLHIPRIGLVNEHTHQQAAEGHIGYDLEALINVNETCSYDWSMHQIQNVHRDSNQAFTRETIPDNLKLDLIDTIISLQDVNTSQDVDSNVSTKVKSYESAKLGCHQSSIQNDSDSYTNGTVNCNSATIDQVKEYSGKQMKISSKWPKVVLKKVNPAYNNYSVQSNTFSDKSEQYVGMSSEAIQNKSDSIYKCQYCPRIFKQNETFQRHQSLLCRKPFVCSLCQQQHTTVKARLQHELTHGNLSNTKRRVYRQKLRNPHHSVKKVFKCRNCLKLFSKYMPFKLHHILCIAINKPKQKLGERKRMAKKPIVSESKDENDAVESSDSDYLPENVCKFCDSTFDLETEFIEHGKNCSKREQISAFGIKSAFRCAKCSEPFVQSDDLRRHEEQCYLLCMFCDLKLGSAALCLYHEETCSQKWRHGMSTSRVAKKKPSESEDVSDTGGDSSDSDDSPENVSKIYQFEKDSKELKTLLDSSKNLTCSTCGETFQFKRGLKRHIQCSHMDYRKLTCRICGRTFHRIDNFKRHKLIHSKPTKGTHSKLSACNSTCKPTKGTHSKLSACNSTTCKYCHEDTKSTEMHSAHEAQCLSKLQMYWKRKFNVNQQLSQNAEENDVNQDGVDKRPAFEEDSAISSNPEDSLVLENKQIVSNNKAKVKRYICTICGKEYGRKYNLKRHMGIHSAQKQFSCTKCARSFHRADGLNTHMEPCHLKCMSCSLRFNSPIQCMNHEETCTDVSDKRPYQTIQLEGKTERDNSEAYMCTVCLKVFVRKDYLVQHCKRIHEGYKELFLCSLCGKNLESVVGLREHELRHTMTERKYLCNVCGNSFFTMKDMRKHELRHSNRDFLCMYCGYQTNQMQHLTNHEATHQPEDSVQCKICGKGFKSKLRLAKHEKIHSVVKNYKCKFCEKLFKASTGKYAHEKTHSEVKAYKCQVCDKTFRLRHHLNQHTRTHTDERPYACEICGDRFKFMHHLHQHVDSHGNKSRVSANINK